MCLSPTTLHQSHISATKSCSYIKDGSRNISRYPGIAQTTDVYARKLLDSIIEFDEEYDDEMDVKESEESA